MVAKNPVVEVATKHLANGNTEITLPTGERVRLRPVAAGLVNEVMSAIKDPPIPMYTNPETGKEEANPMHSSYLEGLKEVNILRSRAAMDAMLMFGVDLLTPVPADNAWIEKLKWLFKHNGSELDLGDLADPINRELLYKKYMVGNTDIITQITKMSGVSEEQVAVARETFQGTA